MYMSIILFINYYNLMDINENSRVDNLWERSWPHACLKDQNAE